MKSVLPLKTPILESYKDIKKASLRRKISQATERKQHQNEVEPESTSKWYIERLWECNIRRG